ncbi:MAG TPA: hypothetical protein VFA89_20955 [Terriglobales bacterium]|nr:hypothetical protein [Terriglobales bacterium]
MLEQGIYEKLYATSDITTRLNTQPNGEPCLFIDFQIKGTKKPSVVMQTSYTSEVYSSDGANNLRFKRIQFDSYSDVDALTAIAVSDAVRNLFKSYKGTLPDGTVVTGSIVQRDQSMPVELAAKESVLYRRLLEIEFQYIDS